MLEPTLLSICQKFLLMERKYSFEKLLKICSRGQCSVYGSGYGPHRDIDLNNTLFLWTLQNMKVERELLLSRSYSLVTSLHSFARSDFGRRTRTRVKRRAVRDVMWRDVIG